MALVLGGAGGAIQVLHYPVTGIDPVVSVAWMGFGIAVDGVGVLLVAPVGVGFEVFLREASAT